VQVNVRNLSQGKNKGLLSYNNDHGTSSLKQHIFNEHHVMCIGGGFVFATNNGGNYHERQVTKKRIDIPPFQITKFWQPQTLY
jgi:hypothetical protein